ncbi:MAG: hypothetical protein ABIC95_05100 [archaeon]
MELFAQDLKLEKDHVEGVDKNIYNFIIDVTKFCYDCSIMYRNAHGLFTDIKIKSPTDKILPWTGDRIQFNQRIGTALSRIRTNHVDGLEKFFIKRDYVQFINSEANIILAKEKEQLSDHQKVTYRLGFSFHHQAGKIELLLNALGQTKSDMVGEKYSRVQVLKMFRIINGLNEKTEELLKHWQNTDSQHLVFGEMMSISPQIREVHSLEEWREFNKEHFVHL